MVPTIIKDPLTNKEETDPKKIKEISVKYVKELLTNRKPEEEYKVDLETKDMLHNERMMEEIPEEEQTLKREQFEETWKQLKATKKEKYQFLFNGGPDIKEVLFALFRVVWEKETCPKLWNKTQITQIFKGVGKVEEPENYRNIHQRNPIGKMFSHIDTFSAKN